MYQIFFVRGEKDQSGQHDIHLDFDGEGPHDADDVAFVDQVLDQQEIAGDGAEIKVGVAPSRASGEDRHTEDQRGKNGSDRQRIDSEDSPDVEVENVRLSFHRPRRVGIVADGAG